MKQEESKSYKKVKKRTEWIKKKNGWKKGLIFEIIGLLISISYFPCISAEVNNNTECNQIYETYLFSEPQLQENEPYAAITIHEANTCITKPGTPVLPVFTKTYTFPFGTNITKIECTPLEITQKIITKKIQPAPEPIPLFIEGKENSKLSFQSYNETVTLYNSSEFYPNTWYEYRISCGLENSMHVIFLTIKFYPVRYSPMTNTIQYAVKADFKIMYQPSFLSISDSDIYDFLIITPIEFSSYLQDFVLYKNSNKIRTKLVTLEEIPATGVDIQESVKYYIKDAIENWNIKFVLLVGNATKFPVRYSYIPADDYEKNFPSDLYYADIYKGTGQFASWDYNKNKRFGEYPYDYYAVDLYPDVYLGRLPCNNINELTNVINNIYYYEENNIWNNNILVCGGDTFVGDKQGIDEGEYLEQRMIENLSSVNFTRIWVPGGTPDTGDIQLTTQSIIDAINTKNFDIVGFNGHGTYDRWGTHPHDREDEWIYFVNNNISLLTNTVKLPIIILGACFCSKFTEDANCLGWAFINKQKHGGIASFGSSGISYGVRGGVSLDVFDYLIFHINIQLYQQKSLGYCWGAALNDYLDFIYFDMFGYKTAEEFILFGDPTINKVEKENYQPNKPHQPSEGTNGKRGHEYTFTTSSTDPNGDPVYYLWDWGDGLTSGWLGPYDSGVIISAEHMWTKKGIYGIKVKAKDIYGAESIWSDPLSVTTPYLYRVIHQFFEWLFQRFPNAFPILRQLIR